MLISDHYRDQNRILHETKPGYGVAGYRHFDRVLEMVWRFRAKSILDYGCGKGTLKDEFRRKGIPIPIQNYDPVTFPIVPKKADLIVSTDVLEHIEPDCLNDVLDHMASLGNWCYMTISTRPARKTLPDGRNAHLIQENEAWWRERMSRWDILEWNVSKEEIELCGKSTLGGMP